MSQNERPKYICFEGLDGSGKSTVFEKVLHALRENGLKVFPLCPTHKNNPDDFLEKIFMEYKFLSNSRFFRQFLYARRSNNSVKSIDKNVDVILGDRSIVTSYVCRWSKSNLKNKFLVAKVNFLESEIFAPDDIFYLSVPHEVLQRRLNLRGNRDIDETAKRSLEMRYAYDFLRENPATIKRLQNSNWHVINGDQPEEKVFKDVWEKIFEVLKRYDLVKGKFTNGK